MYEILCCLGIHLWQIRVTEARQSKPLSCCKLQLLVIHLSYVWDNISSISWESLPLRWNSKIHVKSVSSLFSILKYVMRIGSYLHWLPFTRQLSSLKYREESIRNNLINSILHICVYILSFQGQNILY